MTRSEPLSPDPQPFEFFDRDTLINPYGFYERVRGAGPVVRLENQDRETYLVLSHDVVREVTAQPERFSSKPAQYPGPNFYPQAERHLREQGFGRVPHIISSDPPRHTAYRGVLARALRDKRTHQMRPRIREIAESLVDEFAGAGGCEFVMDYAWRLAILVVAELLGVNKEDIDQFKVWADAWVLPLEQPLTEAEMMGCVEKIAALQHYLVAELEQRVADPQDDVLTDIALATVDLGDGEVPLRRHEQLGMCEALIVAGNDTTASALSLGVLRLAEFPEIAEHIRGDRKLIARFAEESLRYESAVQSNFRTVAQDTEFHGHRMAKGAQVLLSWGAANRDPEAFHHPETFDIDRPALKSHQSFGYGIHSCAGAAIARQELTESYDILLQRLANIRLADGLTPGAIVRTGGIVTHGLQRLPITFAAVAGRNG